MRIALLGDMALIGRYDITTDPTASDRLSEVAEIIKDCDFAIANLESPFTQKKSTFVCKGVYLKSDPLNVKTLTKLGITHVTLANNHTFDYGVKGAKETIKTLKDNGIGYVGLCNEPILLEKDGERALLDGFCCYSANGTRYGNKNMHLRILSQNEMLNFFKKAEKAHAIPIASVHFGIEGVNHPSCEHLNFFRSLFENTDYILHGNHPHSIQGYEKHNNSLLYYACGDLCFDDATETSINSPALQNEDSRRSYIAIIDIIDQHLIHIESICLSDLPSGICKKSTTVSDQLTTYSEDLLKSNTDVTKLRKDKLATLSSSGTKKGLKFIINRLNFKYIGAYLNGKIHARHYRILFNNYLQER